MRGKLWRIMVTIPSLIPLVWLSVLYLFASLCWIKLGHFPRPSLDDPKYMDLLLLYLLSVWGLLLTVFTNFILLPLLPIFVWKKVFSLRLILLMGTGVLLSFVQLFADPFRW